MSENMLNSLLNGNIDVDIFIKWLKNEDIQDCYDVFVSYECSQAEFILYFLNCLHEETLGFLQSNQRVRTPRRIETQINQITQITQIKHTKKPNSRRLFTNQQQTDSEIELGISCLQQTTSTPKLNKSRSSFNKSSSLELETINNVTQLSPIHKSRNNKSSDSSSFCLADFIVQKKSSTKKKTNDSVCSVNNLSHSNLDQNKRRINPTKSQDFASTKRLSTNDNQNCYFFTKIEDDFCGSKNHRELLLDEKNRLKSEDFTSISGLKQKVIENNCFQPCLTSVSNHKQLNIIADVYSLLFDLNLILNPFSELYFLINLALIDQSSEKLEKLDQNPQNFSDLFKNLHNCVYFASIVLNKQSIVLNCLDRTSLRLLSDNLRLKSFNPELNKKLVSFLDKKVDKRWEFVTNPTENVSFISDTDNRENFPSDSSFHAFRKQRDLFYEIYHFWELNHLQNGFNFATTLGYKIRTLVFMHLDPINFIHLARLFKNQLLVAENSLFNVFNDSNDSNIPKGLNIDSNKLNLLKDRLVSNYRGQSPEFPGRLEFFKDFITICNCLSFIRHLTDCISTEILQLDDFTLISSDFQPNYSNNQTAYINTLKSLKILAKFLGYLDSLPYKNDLIANSQILQTQISLRKQFAPSVDITNRLSTAIDSDKLILTLPWIIDYLSMLDYITLRLPYFTIIIQNLFDIYNNFNKFNTNLFKSHLVKFCLGWLFDRANYPIDSYQTWIIKKYQNQFLSIYTNKKFNKNSIDYLDLVDESVLYYCCPFLYEIRNILTSDFNLSKSGPVRYIRPISSTVDNTSLLNRRLQKQLEEAFFKNQPSSTRKTIDLLSERISSVCVKLICNTLIPNAKTHFVLKFKQILTDLNRVQSPTSGFSDCSHCSENQTKCCVEAATKLSEQSFNEFKQTSNIEIQNCAKVRLENCFNALFSDDVHPLVKNTCISISIQIILDRVDEWFKTHVNPGVFLKEFMLEMENNKPGTQTTKKLTYKLPTKGKNVDHDSDVKSPVTLLTNIRELMYLVHEKPEEVQTNQIQNLIEDSCLTCQKRCDLNSIAQFTICRMFFDLYFMIATHRPEITLEVEVLDSFVTFFELYVHKSEKDSFFDRIFCPRNIAIFEQSTELEKTWKSCQLFLVKLLQSGLLKIEQFERQTVSMFRFDFHPVMLKNFSVCVQNVVEFIRQNGGSDECTYIVGWLADYCNDEDFF